MFFNGKSVFYQKNLSMVFDKSVFVRCSLRSKRAATQLYIVVAKAKYSL